MLHICSKYLNISSSTCPSNVCNKHAVLCKLLEISASTELTAPCSSVDAGVSKRIPSDRLYNRNASMKSFFAFESVFFVPMFSRMSARVRQAAATSGTCRRPGRPFCACAS